MNKIKILSFEQLTPFELYDCLYLRSEVFIQEQQCRYYDMDHQDENAIHVLYFNHDKVIGYLRIITNKPDHHFWIGRVVVNKEYRNQKIATKLLKEAIIYCEKQSPSKEIHLAAQTTVLSLYEKLNFIMYGKKFIVDGIEHSYMKYDKNTSD